MKSTYDHPHDVLRFCQSHPDASLIVVTSVHGGAMRSAGALMGVSADDVAGYVSNGCVDADIVAQARRKVPGQLVYGEGSPFRDIQLPCGGRIDLAIIPSPDQDVIAALLNKLDARQQTNLFVTSDYRLATECPTDSIFQTILTPKLQLRIAGRGEALVALSKLAVNTGLNVVLQSPEDLEVPYVPLLNPENVPDAGDDDRTAVVLLFHDHDWELGLLKQALQGPAFYIGALGSERTHSRRKEQLSQMGFDTVAIDRICGPIGLLPAMRDANFLAVSILAEILQTARARGLL